MGVPDSSLLDLIEKVRTWILGRTSEPTLLSGRFDMAGKSCKMTCECEMRLLKSSLAYHCQSCSQVFCGKCQGCVSLGLIAPDDFRSTLEAVIDLKSCQYCSDVNTHQKSARKLSDKIYPSESPRQSPEPPSPSFGEQFDGYSQHNITKSSVASISGHPSPVSVRRSPCRSDEDEGDDSTNPFFSPSSEYCVDTSDIDSSSVSARHEFYSFKSFGSSPSDSPSRIHINSNRVGHSVQQEQQETPRSLNDGPFDQESMAILRKPVKGTGDLVTAYDCADDLSIFQEQCENQQKPLDFENNGLIWFPPPPDDEDEDDEKENNFFAYDDEDDEIGESGAVFSFSDCLGSTFPLKEKHNVDNKEPLQAVIQGHFRALVSQLLQGEGVKLGKENSNDDWLDVVTTVAWQAANFVRPDTSKGGSMDPGDYVKIKCVATGRPSESKLVKGVACTKNIKHKRMTSQYKSPKLLVLGGALEYQRAVNQLASFDTLLQQEKEHLRMVVSKIEAHRPNVLLVEKSVSPYAQELLLAKEISLVLNVKRPLLERIARCTGALITPSSDNISTTRLGHCELFRLEKVIEEHEPLNQFNKKPSKTLMFFEGCPRRLGCTVLLRGLCREELKKIKHVVQYAIFAAYHLSLETSFLADEGASLPKMAVKPLIAQPERITVDNAISVIPGSVPSSFQDEGNLDLSMSEHLNLDYNASASKGSGVNSIPSNINNGNLASNVLVTHLAPDAYHSKDDSMAQNDGPPCEVPKLVNFEVVDETEAPSEYCSATDSHQSILVSFSSRCVLNGNVCERSRLLRIKFYGCFDKPLGRYLQDDLFGQASCCRSCKEPSEAHVICYTHQQGNLTINVRRLPSVKLPGEREGKIWMWHRCLRCAHKEGVPPATRRVVMSDAAWGLSFGKFLELSFSNHATANRIASCGHSLQRDCLRYYGFGSMVAFFRYSSIDIMSVRLPPPVLEFNGHSEQNWIRKEALELLGRVEAFYADILVLLHNAEQKCSSLANELSDTSELLKHILELEDLLTKEKDDYNDLLAPAGDEILEPHQVDILELNRLRHSLLVASHFWDHELHLLDSLLKNDSSSSIVPRDASPNAGLRDSRIDSCPEDVKLGQVQEENSHQFPDLQECYVKVVQSAQTETDVLLNVSGGLEPSMSPSLGHSKQEEMSVDGGNAANQTSLERAPSAGSILSDKIDSAWTGTDQLTEHVVLHYQLQADVSDAALSRQINQIDSPFRRLKTPARVYSFDSALRLQERLKKGLPPSSLHLSTIRSFHASGDYRNMVRDPVSVVERTNSHIRSDQNQKFKLPLTASASIISTAAVLPEGARLMVPKNSQTDVVISVYDNEPTSIISFALSSKEYEDWVTGKPNTTEAGWNANDVVAENTLVSNFTAWPSFGSLDLDYIHYGNYGSEDAPNTISSFFSDPKSSPHLRISFEDNSLNAGGKAKFSVTCYFAKQFRSLRKKCCPSELDFVRSLSRCKQWSAQGGKSNVYFAKSLDERFIIKQVTKTELESFEEFAPQYFKYLTDSLNSGSPTCLAKVLGIYQVTVKHLKGGKEMKMDLVVMENLFFNRTISRVYDLKGSARSRYNSDTTGRNKVLLDLNLLETLRTKPIFLGSKAKRTLERAVWNDTSFLASVDVMDYSLLVGVDDERKELVLGIIDFMRQYTWDKHLETWVKASGILGGPKNASPTIISPKQYKKRFRKAMTTYFLTVPDQWSS